MPHFGFSAAAGALLVLRGVSVIGMHLNGKLVVGKNEFDQNGKFSQRGVARAAPFRRHGVPRLAQSLSGERPIGHARIKSRQPGFTKRLRQIHFFRVPGNERALTPDPRAEEGFKTREDRLHHGLGCGLRARKEFLKPPESFLDALQRRRIRQPQKSWRAKRFAGHQRHV